jgi:N-methylhydantoinase A/oxoprolinase/acetone carboxylase beta subunit
LPSATSCATLPGHSRGQSHELTLPVGDGEFDEAELAARFHRQHERVYGYAPGGRVQVVTYRFTARTPIGGSTPAIAYAADGVAGARRAFPSLGGFVDCPIYERERLPVDAAIAGPAIIEQMDTTTVVLPDQTACSRSARESAGFCRWSVSAPEETCGRLPGRIARPQRALRRAGLAL